MDKCDTDILIAIAVLSALLILMVSWLIDDWIRLYLEHEYRMAKLAKVTMEDEEDGTAS